jgi:hypothetical protein
MIIEFVNPKTTTKPQRDDIIIIINRRIIYNISWLKTGYVIALINEFLLS